ncbi:hypothetical protein CCACVL1_12850 [Corchorus capsularis]|uniref:Uncharacterized protein n=1 Tax=Corchorus capsularis TaxID=210143 RepID=A0A1R3IDF0_COCAP|nr:hypothetical protein CCACVL1_12850 [Corchorus capsularis]
MASLMKSLIEFLEFGLVFACTTCGLIDLALTTFYEPRELWRYSKILPSLLLLIWHKEKNPSTNPMPEHMNDIVAMNNVILSKASNLLHNANQTLNNREDQGCKRALVLYIREEVLLLQIFHPSTL